MRPKVLVLVPTRELAQQVLGVCKRLSHFAKFSSCMVVGGDDYGKQRRALSGAVDVVVDLLQERNEAIKTHRDGREKMALGLSDLNTVRGDLAGRLLAKRLCLDAEATEDRLPAPFGPT